ncbi:eL32 family ribosomal protein, partial [Methanobrevibacter sp.]
MANKRFKRQEYARYKKLGIKWRRPRGKTSKMRRYEAGKPDMPAIGY